MRQNASLVLMLFFSGLFLTGTGFIVARLSETHSPSSPVVARIEAASHDVFILKKHLMEKQRVEKKSSVRALETIETSADGEAFLDFQAGADRIKILPNSMVTLDQEGSRAFLYVKSGDVKVETFGREGALTIVKKGLRLTANEYVTPKSSVSPSLPPVREVEPTSGLSPGYIMETLKSQKGTFYKCYTQLLQKKPGAKGETSVSITIEPSGKISRSEVTNTKFEDAGFKKCLMEATNRMDFKPFAGDSVTTVFPLRFE